MGSQYGYYERRNLPIKPANHVATGTLYDMYNITATTDGQPGGEGYVVGSDVKLVNRSGFSAANARKNNQR